MLNVPEESRCFEGRNFLNRPLYMRREMIILYLCQYNLVESVRSRAGGRRRATNWATSMSLLIFLCSLCVTRSERTNCIERA